MTPVQDQLIDDFIAGFGAAFETPNLIRLAEACEANDPGLQQGNTVFPFSTDASSQQLPWHYCCAVGWATGGVSVIEVAKRFTALMRGERRGPDPVLTLRWNFVDAFDGLPRAQALKATAAACRRLVAERRKLETYTQAEECT
jgi:hypothetical protein